MITSFFSRVTRLNFATIIFHWGPYLQCPRYQRIWRLRASLGICAYFSRPDGYGSDLLSSRCVWNWSIAIVYGQKKWESGAIMVILKYSNLVWFKILQFLIINCSFKLFNCPFSSGISQLATAMMMTSEGTILAAENPSTSQGQSMVGLVYSDDNPQSIQVRISWWFIRAF